MALQAMIIATGLVYNVLMCLGCVAIWRALQIQMGDRSGRHPHCLMDQSGSETHEYVYHGLLPQSQAMVMAPL